MLLIQRPVRKGDSHRCYHSELEAVIGDPQLTRTVSRNIGKAVTLLCNHCETAVRRAANQNGRRQTRR